MRPVVEHVYADPIQIFDSSSHERPAQVLHSLRTIVGDARFFSALHTYYMAYRGRTAATHDFFSSMSRSLRMDLGWFEDEWFHRACVPHYLVAERYDAGARTLALDVSQQNCDGKAFRMPVTVEAYAAGRVYRVRPIIARDQQTVLLRNVAVRPQMVLFDPDATILKQLTFAKSPEELAYQLASARHVADREWALTQLAAEAAHRGSALLTAQRAVSAAARHDAFYGIRGDAVGVAATFGDAGTVARALRDPDVRVRIAALGAAGALVPAAAQVTTEVEALAKSADAGEAAAALGSLGAMKTPGAYDTLVDALDRPSSADELARGAIAGLEKYGDQRALPVLLAHTKYGTPEQERNAAIVAFAELAARTNVRAAAVPVLAHILLTDPLIASRIAAVSALDTLGDGAALPVLLRAEHTDAQKIVQLDAEDAVADVRDAVALRAYQASHPSHASAGSL